MKTTNKKTSNQAKNMSDVDVLYLNEVFKNDLKSSVLVVSLLVNLFVFTSYLVVQTTSAYDGQVIGFLLTR